MTVVLLMMQSGNGGADETERRWWGKLSKDAVNDGGPRWRTVMENGDENGVSMSQVPGIVYERRVLCV